MLLKTKKKVSGLSVRASQNSASDSGISSQESTQPKQALPSFRNPFRKFVLPHARQQSPLRASRSALASPSPRSRPAPRRLTSPGTFGSVRSSPRVGPTASPFAGPSRATPRASPAGSTHHTPAAVTASPAGQKKSERKLQDKVAKDLKAILNSEAFLEEADQILENSDELSEFCETLEASFATVGSSLDDSPVRKKRQRARVTSSDEESEETEEEPEKAEEEEEVVKKKKKEKREEKREKKEKKKKVKSAVMSQHRLLESGDQLKKKKKKKTGPVEFGDGPSTSRAALTTGSDVEMEDYKFRFFTTWVECVRCLKWRHLRAVFDPASVDDDWTCEMNEDPLAASKGCQAPEQTWDEEALSRCLLIGYTEGSLVWARVQGYPAWPAMIDRDPDSQLCYELPAEELWEEEPDGVVLPEPVFYHVTFLDKDVSRAWVARRNLKPFRGVADMKGLNFKIRSRDYRSEVMATAIEAEKALKLDLQTRLRKFGFAFRWTGRANQWTGPQKQKTPRTRSCASAKRRKVDRKLEIMNAETQALTSEANKLLESIEQRVLRASQS